MAAATRAHGSVPADRKQGIDAPVNQVKSGLGAGFVDTSGTREAGFQPLATTVRSRILTTAWVLDLLGLYTIPTCRS